MQKKKKRDIVGVILAAGKGTRLEPFSRRFPKPILPICNKPILQYQIESMRDLGIRKIMIVISHLGFEIARTLGDGEEFGVEIQYIDQGETLGIAHAVGRLESRISTPFLLFLGDIFFLTKDLGIMLSLLEKKNTSAVLAVKREDNPEAIKRNFAVILDRKGLVKRVIEKPRYVTNDLKGCGLYLFDLHIFDAIRRTPRTAMRDEYEITDAIQILVDDGFKVNTAEVVEWDLNVSYPPDLLEGSLQVLKARKKRKVIGEHVKLHPDARLINTVIGKNARVTRPITIRNSVIFPDTEVKLKKDINRTIITPDTMINCEDYREKP
jgi:dTDP-glucose pyrophosphorylase